MRRSSQQTLSPWTIRAVAVAYVLLGIDWIWNGLAAYEVWDAVAGLGCLLLVPVILVLPRGASRFSMQRQRVLRRAASASAILAIILELTALATQASLINPIAWFLPNATTIPATIVRHPFIYNHQRVRSAGHVFMDEHGWCMLGAAAPSSTPPALPSRTAAPAIALAIAQSRCTASDAPRDRVEVSGTFLAYRPGSHGVPPYLLTDVQMATARTRVDGA